MAKAEPKKSDGESRAKKERWRKQSQKSAMAKAEPKKSDGESRARKGRWRKPSQKTEPTNDPEMI